VIGCISVDLLDIGYLIGIEGIAKSMLNHRIKGLPLELLAKLFVLRTNTTSPTAYLSEKLQ
jgi:hypothetical protein